MSWRWIIDVRGREPRVDRPRLTAATVGGIAFAVVLLAVLPSPLDYIVCGVLVLIGIAVDVFLRRPR